MEHLDDEAMAQAAVAGAVAFFAFALYWMLVWEVSALSLPRSRPSTDGAPSQKPVWKPDPSARDSAKRVKFPAYENLPKSVMVTGGLGFLGRHLVEALAGTSCERIVVFDLPVRDRSRLSWVEALSKKHPSCRVEVVEGNLVNPADLSRALAGCEAVIHCASPHPQTSSDEVLHKVLVEGSDALARACEAAGVRVLVLTSSASVVFSGVDQPGADEATPIPSTFRDKYAECKAASEQIFLAVGGRATRGPKGRGLLTTAVRPHGIFGPRDTQMVPGVCEVSSTWRGRLILGDGSNTVDFTYVGNVVHGHLLALAALNRERLLDRPGGVDGSVISGRPFFITNDDPIPFWSFIARVKAMLRYPPSTVRIPYRLALTIASIQEVVGAAVASMRGQPKPQLHLSPQRVSIAGTAHWYRVDHAKAALGYKPLWNLDQALAITAAAYADLEYAGAGGVISPFDLAGSSTAKKRPCEGPQGEYTAAQVAAHNTEESAWIIVDDGVYDVTSYLDNHPGGPRALLRVAGKDATKGFHGTQHPDSAADTREDFRVGSLIK
jgi:sterol-4alpha-carboxylate 3-dehydrogenase (decarboxylating)